MTTRRAAGHAPGLARVGPDRCTIAAVPRNVVGIGSSSIRWASSSPPTGRHPRARALVRPMRCRDRSQAARAQSPSAPNPRVEPGSGFSTYVRGHAGSQRTPRPPATATCDHSRPELAGKERSRPVHRLPAVRGRRSRTAGRAQPRENEACRLPSVPATRAKRTPPRARPSRRPKSHSTLQSVENEHGRIAQPGEPGRWRRLPLSPNGSVGKASPGSRERAGSELHRAGRGVEPDACGFWTPPQPMTATSSGSE